MVNIHTYRSRFTPTVPQRYLRDSSETPTFYQNYLAMRDTVDVKGGKPITA
jgi:hypothetical protein